MNVISAYIPNKLACTLPEKIAMLHRLKISHLELSSEDLPLESLNANEVFKIRNLFIQEGCTIHLYKAPPKLQNHDDFHQLLRNAHLLDVGNILFDLSAWSNEEIDYCLNATECFGITSLIENQSETIFKDPDAIMNFFQHHQNSMLNLLFNPLEFLKTGRHPFFHVYYSSRIKGKIAALRITDGLYMDGRPVLPGDGNGEVKELISIMKARSFHGFFSITPYLHRNTEDDYIASINWLRKILKSI